MTPGKNLVNQQLFINDVTAVITLISLTNVSAEIKDGIFITVGNKAITKSDIVQEMKLILILNNMPYTVEKKNELERMAVNSTIKRTIKEIEINKYQAFEYSKAELNNELIKLSNNIDMDVETLRNVCISNGLDFKNIRQVHLFEPWYNLSKHEQIIGRAIRWCSHIDLKDDERNVEVYQYAAKTPPNISDKIYLTRSAP